MRLYLGALAVALGQAPAEQDSAIHNTSGAVARLTGLLQSLKSKLEQEFKDATQNYDTAACGYEDTIKESEQTIKDSVRREEELTEAIEKNAADLAAITARVEHHKKTQAKKEKEVEDATAVRRKEHIQYASDVDEMQKAISSAHDAYTLLKGAKDSANYAGRKEGFLETVRDGVETVIKASGSDSRVESLHEFLRASVQKSFLQSGWSSASDSIVGILRDMRGEYISQVQAAQEQEEEKARKHENHMAQLNEQIRTLQFAVEEGEARQSEIDSDKSNNEEDRENTQQILADARKLLADTDAAAKALATEYAETSNTHNDEMHGISTAIDFLTQQGQVHTLFIQTASKGNKDFANIFAKINWKIDDMVELHRKEKGDNKTKKAKCQTLVTNVEENLAKRKAQLATVDGNIKRNGAEKQAAGVEKDALKKERQDNENAKSAAQTAWETTDAGRAKEIAELKESSQLIGGAKKALEDAGSGRDSLKNVIKILEMVQAECDRGQELVGKTKLSEADAWSKQKKEMVDLSAALKSQMDELTAVMLAHTERIQELEAQQSVLQNPISVEEKEKCETFLDDFTGMQTKLDASIRSLTNAKTQLEGWQNQEKTHALATAGP